jgi:hypothetical protein
MRRKTIAATLSVLLLALGSGAPVTAAPPGDCSATFTIFSTSAGTVTTAGPVTHFRDAGVAGVFSGVLDGTPVSGSIAGAQDVTRNDRSEQAESKGRLTATLAGGTVVVEFLAHLDLADGTGKGRARIVDGTGQFAGLRGSGDYTAQKQAPLTYQATILGHCKAK